MYSTTPEVAISDLLDEPWDKLCPKELAAAALDLATFWPTCLGSSEQVRQRMPSEEGPLFRGQASRCAISCATTRQPWLLFACSWSVGAHVAACWLGAR